MTRCTRRDLLFTAGSLSVVSACRRKDGELGEVINLADESMSPQLLRGFHPVEQNSWRWTQSKFAVALKPPRQSASGAVLVMKFSFPEAVQARLKSTTIHCSVDGIPLPPEICTKSGMQELRREVPPEALRGKTGVIVEFSVDPFPPAGSLDERELALIVHTIGLVKEG
jgi:hypothetical protein